MTDTHIIWLYDNLIIIIAFVSGLIGCLLPFYFWQRLKKQNRQYDESDRIRILENNMQTLQNIVLTGDRNYDS